jgi:hypothetical protein
MKFSPLLLPALLISCFSMAAWAAEIEIDFVDAPGQGFYDTAVVTPIDGNAGATLGEQRRIAMMAAMQELAATIDSSVPIAVEASFTNLECDARSAVLGAAAPTTAVWDFAGAPDANTLYPIAVANAFAAVDLDPGFADIIVTMNADIDFNNNCLSQSDWFYGLNAQGPASSVNFREVAIHELSHGLGFLTFVDPYTGQNFLNRNDAFSSNLFDADTAKYWPEMTDAERLASHTSTVVWRGDRGRCIAQQLDTGKVLADDYYYPAMHSPNPIEPGSSISHWSTAISPSAVMTPYIGFVPLLSLTGSDNSLLADIGWQGIFADGNNDGVDDCSELIVTPTYTKQSFELATLPAAWSQSPTSNASWIIDSSEFSDGSYSLRADSIGNNQVAGVDWTADFGAGFFSFDVQLDSEQDYDFLIFSVDGAEQFRVAGDVAWQNKSVQLPAGVHTLSWQYVKDEFVSDGADTAWIDNIQFVSAVSTVDTDGDGIGNNADLDDDNDGISDVVENIYAFLDPLNALDAAEDFDQDGYSNLDELEQGTAPDNSNDKPGLARAVKSDFNGDGIADIFWRNALDGSAEIAIANSVGATSRIENLPSKSADWTAQLGDFNGDSAVDTLWRNATTGAVVVAISDTNGNQGMVNELDAKGSVWLSQIGDFNGDGRDDILWRKPSEGFVRVGISNADGDQQRIEYFFNKGAAWQAFVGDFNGDGRDDMLWRRGTDGASKIILTDANGAQANVVNVLAFPRFSAWQVQIGDLNNDGRDDILWRKSSDGTVKAGISGADGKQASSVNHFAKFTAWTATLSDFNGDGGADILWRKPADGTVKIAITGEAGQQASVVGLPARFSAWTQQLGDYNGDGRNDILWHKPASGEVKLGISSPTGFQQSGMSLSNKPSGWMVVQ